MPDYDPRKPLIDALAGKVPAAPKAAKPAAAPKPVAAAVTPQYEELPDEHWQDMNQETSRIADRINRKGQEATYKRLTKNSNKRSDSGR